MNFAILNGKFNTKKLPGPLNFFLLLVWLTISGCSSTRQWRRELEEEWLGKTKQELIERYGTPFQINTEDSPGNEIYIYKHHDFTPDIPPNTYTKDFFINQKGIIFKIETYSW